MLIRALSRTDVYRPHFSYVPINMNTISKQMGFTLSQCDVPVSVHLCGAGYPGHTGVSVSLSAAAGCL